jgi:hypothetical protein
MYQDAGNALSHVVPEPAKLADVQATCRVVQVQDRLSRWLRGRVHIFIILNYKFQLL